MPVEDVFTITGRASVATGRVERGQLKTAEEVKIVGLADEKKKKTVVTGIEMFRRFWTMLGPAITSALCSVVSENEIERGQVQSKPGSSYPSHQVLGARCTF